MDETNDPTNQPKKSPLPIILFVLFLIIVGAFLYFNSTSYKLKHIKNTVENVVTEKVNLATATEEQKVPAAFPSNMPIDTGTITQSYTMDYVDRKLVQSVVTYTSSESKEDLFNTYSKYMASTGFEIRPNGSDLEQGYLSARKDNDDLTVNISSRLDARIVHLVFLDR